MTKKTIETPPLTKQQIEFLGLVIRTMAIGGDVKSLRERKPFASVYAWAHEAQNRVRRCE